MALMYLSWVTDLTSGHFGPGVSIVLLVLYNNPTSYEHVLDAESNIHNRLGPMFSSVAPVDVPTREWLVPVLPRNVVRVL